MSVQHELAPLTVAVRRLARQAIQAHLLPHVVLMAARRGGEGLTADDVRYRARVVGLITDGAPEQRSLSWIGPWLAGLARRGILVEKLGPDNRPVERPSLRKAAHGNLQVVYLSPPSP